MAPPSKLNCGETPEHLPWPKTCSRPWLQVLSRASRLVAFALPITPGHGILKEIEFVPLSSTKVLVIVVADGGQVSRKAIDVGEEIEAQALRQASNYLNTEFAGMPLEHIRLADHGTPAP